MAIEFRPITADEMDQYTLMDQIGFGGSTAPDEIKRVNERTMVRPEYTLCAYEGDTQVAHMAAFPGSMRWNGRDIACAGIVDVTTLPTHRRRGLVRGLMTRYFLRMRKENRPVAMLWASMAAIYQRFGYGIAFTMRRCDFDPRHLRFVDEIATPGRTRLLSHEEAIPLIAAAYARFAAPRTLMLHRDPQWWARWVLRPWRTPPWLVAVYEEDGDVQGYVIYSPLNRTNDRSPGPPQQLQVSELIWNTPAAHRALVALLAGHVLASSILLYNQPVDDPLFYQAQEPRLLGAAARDGTLLRLVDVEQALAGRGYDGDGRLVLAVEDDLCPWNTGSFELSVDGGHAEVRRVTAESDIWLSPRALAILCAGRQSATELARIGTIAGTEADALKTADALFRTAYAPFCADDF